VHKRHNRITWQKMSRAQRERVIRILSIVHEIKLAEERGANSENRVERALEFLRNEGVLTFNRSKSFDKRDLAGIDFEIEGLDPYKCHFTIDVKSSWTGVQSVLEQNEKRGKEHNYPLRVEDHDSRKTLAIKIMEIFRLEMA